MKRQAPTPVRNARIPGNESRFVPLCTAGRHDDLPTKRRNKLIRQSCRELPGCSLGRFVRLSRILQAPAKGSDRFSVAVEKSWPVVSS